MTTNQPEIDPRAPQKRSQGIIRTGSGNKRKPFKKSTNEEMEERYEFTQSLIRKRPFYKHLIIEQIVEKYDVSRRTAEEYIARARDQLLKRILNSTRDERLRDSLGFYESVIDDPNSENSDKIQAQKQIDRILGLHAPVKVEHSGEVTSNIVNVDDVGLSIEQRRELIQKMKKAEEESKAKEQSRVSFN